MHLDLLLGGCIDLDKLVNNFGQSRKSYLSTKTAARKSNHQDTRSTSRPHGPSVFLQATSPIDKSSLAIRLGDFACSLLFNLLYIPLSQQLTTARFARRQFSFDPHGRNGKTSFPPFLFWLCTYWARKGEREEEDCWGSFGVGA